MLCWCTAVLRLYDMVTQRQQLKDLEEWAADINRRNAIALVEGPMDEVALQVLGVSRVMGLNKRPLYEVVEELSVLELDVAILTDLDSEGDKLLVALRRDLIALGVHVTVSHREWLRMNTSVRQVEDLRGYVENLRGVIFGPEV